MSQAYEYLQKLNFFQTGEKLSSENLIKTQKYLAKNNIVPMPQEFVDFLHHYNSFAYSGGNIYGVFGSETPINNIVFENLNNPIDGKIILGNDEFDILVFEKDSNSYQILDRSDLEVLEEYNNFKDAFLHIIKI